MTDSPDLSKFQRRLAERRAREERERLAAEESSIFHPDDLVPEHVFERSEADQEIDRIIDGIDIVDSYRRWCGKMIPVVRGGQTEGIKISCPIPGHVDSDPSAWINLDKQTWFCGGCQVGGDKYDIAAYSFGMPVPGYKEGQTFHQLREKMATDFGYHIQRHPGGSVTVTAPIIEPEEETVTEPVEPPSADVIKIYDDVELEAEIEIPTLDWRPVVPKDTFLDAYMKATVVDDVPEEYHLFHGLIALGFALGRDVSLFDAVPVYGNLFVCTLGRSGTGKSKARYHLDKLLASALPHDWTNPNSKGVRRVSAPGSAENLIFQFSKPVEDPSNPKVTAYYAAVRGLIDFNELSSLLARTNRQGSAMKPTLMQFYDMEDVVATSSMTHGEKKAERPFASALTTTQPRALRTLLSNADDASGFLNRWVFVPGKEKVRFSVGGIKVDTSAAIKPLQKVAAWAATFGAEQIEWSEEALVTWDHFFQTVVERDKKASDNDLIVRLDLTMKKLMLLFAANRLEKTLSEQSVLDAIHCYGFLKASYGIPEAQIGNTLTNEVTEAILFQIDAVSKRNGGKGATIREIARNLQRRKYPPKMLNDAIDALMKLDMIEVETHKAGQVGRPTKRYKRVSA